MSVVRYAMERQKGGAMSHTTQVEPTPPPRPPNPSDQPTQGSP
jgi:hypothetical protein